MKKIIVFAFVMGFTLTSFAQKADSTKTTTIRLRGNTLSSAVQPLIVIDGNQQYSRDISMIKDLDPNNIESVTILKDSSAISLYGPEGFAGVIDIKTKDSKARSSTVTPGSQLSPSLKGKVSGFTIRPKNQLNENPNGSNFSITKNGIKLTDGAASPLYIIDGEETTDSKSISPDTIDSIEVLKDGTAQKLYGDKAKNGVIIIKTKNAKPLPKKK